MKLLRALRLGPRVRRIPLHPAAWAAWAAFFAGSELLGRRSRSELQDGLGVLALLAVIVLTMGLHRQQHSPRLRRLFRKARRRLRAFLNLFPTVGLDLRREPPLPRAAPRILLWLLAPGWLLVAVRLVAGPEPVAALRDVLHPLSPTLTFVLEGALWAALLACSLFLAACTAVSIYVLVRNSRLARLPRLHRTFWWLTGAYAAAFVVAGALTPLGLPRIVVLALFGGMTVLILLPANPSILYLWRPRTDPHGDSHVIEARYFGWLCEAALVGFVLGISLLGWSARDPELAAVTRPGTPITGTLSAALAWSAVALYPFWYWVFWLTFSNGWLRDPARPVPATLHVDGGGTPAARRRLRDLLRAAGLRARFAPDPIRRGEVAVRLRDGDPLDLDRPLRWPLDLNPPELGRSEVLECLRRRDVQQRRRHLRRGLEKAFRAAGRSFREGSGFLVAPHLWHIEGLSRDQDEEGQVEFCVGPRYRRVLPLAARSHLYEVLTALEIDLVFVEDGVGFRRFRRVLDALFEIFDAHRGAVAAEERMLQHVPGLRMILHDLAPRRPWLDSDYPEPEYEEIARARILHVFLDRGEEDETADQPFEFDFVPDTPDLILSDGGR